MSYYGNVYPEFWTGDTGRELRRHGKDAQLLALYLVSNAHANMIGLYPVAIEHIHLETGLSRTSIERAFAVLAETGYASYDPASGYVWVRTMVRYRLGLRNGDTLAVGDNRVAGVNRLYLGIGHNAFLGEFYDLNHSALRLTRRRASSNTTAAVGKALGTSSGKTLGKSVAGHPAGKAHGKTGNTLVDARGTVLGAQTKGLHSPSKGPQKGLRSQVQKQRSGTETDTGTGIRDQSQVQERAAADAATSRHAEQKPKTIRGFHNAIEPEKLIGFAPHRGEDPAHNLSVITKLAHQTYDLAGVSAKPSEVAETVKWLCAGAKIAYSSEVVRKACDSALAQRKWRGES